MSAPSKGGVSNLGNPAWPKSSRRAGTELCVYRGSELCDRSIGFTFKLCD